MIFNCVCANQMCQGIESMQEEVAEPVTVASPKGLQTAALLCKGSYLVKGLVWRYTVVDLCLKKVCRVCERHLMLHA